MKKIVFYMALGSAILYASPDVSVYDEQFRAISKVRVGLSDADILSIKDPFFKDVPVGNIEEAPDLELVGQKLTAILANKVKISDSWYSLGDYIGSYRIMEIKSNSVIIENEKNNLELKLEQGNQNVVITIN